jgi:hypothetical protein
MKSSPYAREGNLSPEDCPKSANRGQTMSPQNTQNTQKAKARIQFLRRSAYSAGKKSPVAMAVRTVPVRTGKRSKFACKALPTPLAFGSAALGDRARAGWAAERGSVTRSSVPMHRTSSVKWAALSSLDVAAARRAAVRDWNLKS